MMEAMDEDGAMKLKVGGCTGGMIWIDGTGESYVWRRILTVSGAALFADVLAGRLETACTGGDGDRGDPMGISCPHPCCYIVYDRDEERVLFTLNEPQAAALRLALEREIADAVRDSGRDTGDGDAPAPEVWLLLSTGVLTGDAAVDGADQIGTRAFAYATREAACGALREFMRPDVVESRPEGRWDEDDMTVDDALDFIFKDSDDLGSDGDGLWTWDGTNRSYEWRLMRLGVEQ